MTRVVSTIWKTGDFVDADLLLKKNSHSLKRKPFLCITPGTGKIKIIKLHWDRFLSKTPIVLKKLKISDLPFPLSAALCVNHKTCVDHLSSVFFCEKQTVWKISKVKFILMSKQP